MIVFRCDAGVEVGFGHLVRCRQLAKELAGRGYALAMFGPSAAYKNHEDAALFKTWHEAPDWTNDGADAAELLAFGQTVGAAAYILDNHRIEEAYQLCLRQAGVKFLLFEGRSDRPIWADILFAAHAAADPNDYRPQLRNSDCQMLVGTQFALLRDSFRGRALLPVRSDVNKIFLTFGGGSDRGAFQLILKTLMPLYPALKFCLVCGSKNPNITLLSQMAKEHPEDIDLHVDTDQVADLMGGSDFAIMAAGTSSLEAATVGLPMMLISIADNQVIPAKAWAERGAAIYLGDLGQITRHDLVQQVEQMLPYSERLAKSKALRSLKIDAMGPVHVADAIDDLIAPVYE